MRETLTEDRMAARVVTFVAKYLIWLIPAGFAGSASASTAQDVSELVNAWIGHTEDELLQVWGEGDRRTSTSGNTLHVYSARGRGGGNGNGRFSQSVNSFPVGRNRSGSDEADGIDETMRERGGCDVSFEIQRGVVARVTWSTEGSPDRDAALRTCWREFRRNEAE